MSEMDTTGNVTALRAVSIAMSVLALMSWGGFAYGINALRDSPVAVERASGQATAPAGPTPHRAG